MLFRSVADSTLRMQFGHDDPLEVEPGETVEVPDHWASLVVSRGYRVEPVGMPEPALESDESAPEEGSPPKKRGRRKAAAEGDDAG